MKRIEQSWETLFALKDVLRRNQKKDLVFGWMKKGKKKTMGTPSDEMLAQKLSEVTLTSKQDAIVLAQKDSEVAKEIFAEPEDMSLATKVRRSYYARKAFPADHLIPAVPGRLE